MGLPLTLSDLNEMDRHYWPALCHIRDCQDLADQDRPDDLTLSQLDLPFSTSSASGRDVSLSPHHRRVTRENRDLYVRLALELRLHEFDAQIEAVRCGLGCVVPLPLLALLTGPELEAMVCGSPEIPLALLKSVTTYKVRLSIHLPSSLPVHFHAHTTSWVPLRTRFNGFLVARVVSVIERLRT